MPLTLAIQVHGLLWVGMPALTWSIYSGWDWAPYSFMRTTQGLQSWTRGIWKSVYLVPVKSKSALITSVRVTTAYKGAGWPTNRLVDGDTPFSATITTFLRAPISTTGTMKVSTDWGPENSSAVLLPEGDSEHAVQFDAKSVNLWWPRGHGDQVSRL